MAPKLMEQELHWGKTGEEVSSHGQPAARFVFGSNMDRAAGFFSGVTSGITGRTLRYFTPDPLPDLLLRVATGTSKARPDRDRYAPLLLLRASSQRPAEPEPNIAQARRLMSVVYEGRRFQSMNALIELGHSISPQAGHIREELIFVGGPNSSCARHIYAPHGAVPDLMRSLVKGLSHQAVADIDPLVVTATIAAFCNYAHPFKDGNGRWSRVIALSSSASPMHAWPAMVVIAFLNACRARLTNEIFPQAAACGLRSYLTTASSFEDKLTSELEGIGAFPAATTICEMLRDVARQPAKWRLLASELFVSGRIHIEPMRAICGVSRRVADGLSDRVVSTLPHFAVQHEDSINIELLLRSVRDAVEEAARATQST